MSLLALRIAFGLYCISEQATNNPHHNYSTQLCPSIHSVCMFSLNDVSRRRRRKQGGEGAVGRPPRFLVTESRSGVK